MCADASRPARARAAGAGPTGRCRARRRCPGRRRPRRTHGTAPGPCPAAAGPHENDTDSTLSSVARALDHAAAQRAEVDAEPGASEGEASSAAARQAAHPLPRVPRVSWAWLDTVELAAEFASPVPTLQGIPGFMLPGVRRAWAFALRALCTDDPRTGATQVRAWKLFLLLPRLLFTRGASRVAEGKAELLQRISAFHAGRWEALLDRTSELPTSAQLRARACAQVRQGHLSRARRTLTSASLAPGDEATLAGIP